MQSRSKLSKAQINTLISPYFCSVATNTTDGTGYLTKFEDQFVVLSSFHLVGSVVAPTYQSPNTFWLRMLQANQYLSKDGALTKKAYQLIQAGDIVLDATSKFIDHTTGETYQLKGEILGKFQATHKDKEHFVAFVHQHYHEKRVELQHSEVTIKLGDEYYTATLRLPNNPKARELTLLQYAHLDMAPFVLSPQPNLPEFEPCPVATVEMLEGLASGETVYYGGFPLTQTMYTFSKGMISCVNRSDLKSDLVIEAPVAMGNSGSPVFVQREGQVYFIGLMSAALASVTDELLDIQRKLHAYKSEQGGALRIGGISLTDTFDELTDTLLHNLSTGKGRAILINPDQHLRFPEPDDTLCLRLQARLDFYTGKRTTVKHLPLFQHINQHHLTEVTERDLMHYLTQQTDTLTRRALIQAKRKQLRSLRILVDRPLVEDIAPSKLKDNARAKPGKGEFRMISDKGQDENIPKRYLKHLYRFCYWVSQGLIKLNQWQFHTDSPRHGNDFITQKYVTDHGGAGNAKLTDRKAEEDAARRTVARSTTMRGPELEDLNKEVKGLQRVFKQLFESGGIKQCAKQAANHGHVFEGLFFKTRQAFQQATHTKSTQGKERKRTSFFYSVSCREGVYLAHHYEGQEVKPGWQKLNMGSSEPEIYYSTKPAMG